MIESTILTKVAKEPLKLIREVVKAIGEVIIDFIRRTIETESKEKEKLQLLIEHGLEIYSNGIGG